MAEAARSLSPKQVLERLQRHRSAVAVLAMQSARREVKAQIRAKGHKVAHYSAREISVLAEVELQRNRPRFVAEAEHAINTWPAFARWRLPKEVFVKSTEIEHSPKADSAVAGEIANG